MRRAKALFICVFLAVFSQHSLGQTELAKSDDHSVARALVPTKQIVAKSEVATLLYDPVKCDSEGNVYYPTDMTGAGVLRELNLEGERIAEFRPGANPDMPIDVFQDYTIGPDGEVFMLVYPHEITRYIFVYKSDGSYHSSIKLDTGFPWVPTAFAIFPSGGFLIAGLEYARSDKGKLTQVPFTGVFSADGRLLKQLNLEDDDDIVDFAASGDPRVVSASGNNRAIEFTKMEAAADGNIYLMRWTNPAIIYAISPGGSVVRRFIVDPHNSNDRPLSMHVAENRIAVLFATGDSKADVMKILDLEGTLLGTYSEVVNEKTTQRVGSAFACFTTNPEHFIFFSVNKDDHLDLEIAEPR